MTPNDEMLTYLRRAAEKGIYAIEIPRPLARTMEEAGWIEWVPPMFSTPMWKITDAGREVLR